jgi:hypothetical protein
MGGAKLSGGEGPGLDQFDTSDRIAAERIDDLFRLAFGLERMRSADIRRRDKELHHSIHLRQKAVTGAAPGYLSMALFPSGQKPRLDGFIFRSGG